MKLQVLIFCFLVRFVTLQNISDESIELMNVTIALANSTNVYSIEVNDNITIDYVMDDANLWKLTNVTLDEAYYSETVFEPENVFSQIVMNQLKANDGRLAVDFPSINDSEHFNHSNNLTKRTKAPTIVKSDEFPWPIKKEAVVDGHVILGGLMMVHEREDNQTCGPIMPQGGIQALEAMLFTLDRINEMKLLNNITIGAHILDDCDKDTYGLEMAVDFIRGES